MAISTSDGFMAPPTLTYTRGSTHLHNGYSSRSSWVLSRVVDSCGCHPHSQSGIKGRFHIRLVCTLTKRISNILVGGIYVVTSANTRTHVRTHTHSHADSHTVILTVSKTPSWWDSKNLSCWWTRFKLVTFFWRDLLHWPLTSMIKIPKKIIS